MKKISPSLEDYLETIYFLKLKKSSVRVTDIALELGIAKPSVINAISKLIEGGYVTQERYGLVVLTEFGQRNAKIIFSKHTTIKNFLIKVVGVSDEVAEDEACKIEHIISQDTIDKMKKLTESVAVQN